MCDLLLWQRSIRSHNHIVVILVLGIESPHRVLPHGNIIRHRLKPHALQNTERTICAHGDPCLYFSAHGDRKDKGELVHDFGYHVEFLGLQSDSCKRSVLTAGPFLEIGLGSRQPVQEVSVAPGRVNTALNVQGDLHDHVRTAKLGCW